MTKYTVKYSTEFKKSLKKVTKQGKNIDKLIQIITKLANKELLELKFKNHKLKDDGYFCNCYKCHIEPDWSLDRYIEEEIILLLVKTGTHSDLF